jgi:DNA-directed RNA polymerase specialized sigma24 family protein
MMSEKQFEQLIRKLDTLIKLVAGSLLKDTKNKTEKVGILDELGIATKEIASLVGTTEKSVETMKKRVRRKRKEMGGKKAAKT